MVHLCAWYSEEIIILYQNVRHTCVCCFHFIGWPCLQKSWMVVWITPCFANCKNISWDIISWWTMSGTVGWQPCSHCIMFCLFGIAWLLSTQKICLQHAHDIDIVKIFFFTIWGPIRVYITLLVGNV